MPSCRYEGCIELVQNDGDLCLKHLLEFLAEMPNPLQGDDLSFLMANHDGCTVSDAALYLDVLPKFIGLFLEYKRGLKGYQGRHRFLNQSLLLLVLVYRDGIMHINEELEPRQKVTTPKEKPSPEPLPEFKSYHQVKLGPGELSVRDVAGKLDVAETTVIKWVRRELIPYTERPSSMGGRLIKVFQSADVINFAENTLNDPDFRRYHIQFKTFLYRESPRT